MVDTARYSIRSIMKGREKIWKDTEDRKVRWFIGDFTLAAQYFASSLSVICHDRRYHRPPTIIMVIIMVGRR